MHYKSYLTDGSLAFSYNSLKLKDPLSAYLGSLREVVQSNIQFCHIIYTKHKYSSTVHLVCHKNVLAILLGPKVIKPFPRSTQLSTKFILLINVKMPTILAFISMIIQLLRDLKQDTSSFVNIEVFYEQLKFRAQLT